MSSTVLAPATGYAVPAALRAYGFWLALPSQSLSRATRNLYHGAARQFADYLQRQGMPTDVTAVSREHVESWLADLQATGSPASTVNNRYRSLQPFWRWLAEEGEIKVSPMANMRPPRIPETPAPVPTDDDVNTLLRHVLRDKGYEGVRDFAMLQVLVASGCRRAELAGMTTADFDARLEQVTVTGKGSRTRTAPLDNVARNALLRYERVRARHPLADTTTAYWLGRKGGMTGDGVRQMLDRRATAAGVPGIHPHSFRHAFAHRALLAGMNETSLMRLMGWRSRAMVGRYAASTATARAHVEYQRLLGNSR